MGTIVLHMDFTTMEILLGGCINTPNYTL